MKKVLAVLTLLFVIALVVPVAFAQTADVSNLYAGGVSYNHGATPAIAGTGLWAHKVADIDGKATYAFTAVDALPTTLKPLTVNTNFSAGIAQKVFSFGKIPIFIPTSAGVSYNGQNTGWAWTTGAMAAIKFKSNYYLCPNVRLVKSSVSGGTGYQPVIGVLFGWGQ